MANILGQITPRNKLFYDNMITPTNNIYYIQEFDYSNFSPKK